MYGFFGFLYKEQQHFLYAYIEIIPHYAENFQISKFSNQYIIICLFNSMIICTFAPLFEN